MAMKKDPIPSYTGINTFMRAPLVAVDDIQPETIVVFGVPHDTGTRQGSRLGPKVIREASAHFKYYIETDESGELSDMSSGKTLKWVGDGKIGDAGDINIYPNDVLKTCGSISATMEEITAPERSRSCSGVTILSLSPASVVLLMGFKGKIPKRALDCFTSMPIWIWEMTIR